MQVTCDDRWNVCRLQEAFNAQALGGAAKPAAGAPAPNNYVCVRCASRRECRDAERAQRLCLICCSQERFGDDLEAALRAQRTGPSPAGLCCPLLRIPRLI
jgi:hypothetical protein